MNLIETIRLPHNLGKSGHPLFFAMLQNLIQWCLSVIEAVMSQFEESLLLFVLSKTELSVYIICSFCLITLVGSKVVYMT